MKAEAGSHIHLTVEASPAMREAAGRALSQMGGTDGMRQRGREGARNTDEAIELERDDAER